MDLQSSANTCFEQIFYTAQTALAYSVGRVAHGLANNGLTDAQRAALSPDDPEYRAAYVDLFVQGTEVDERAHTSTG